MKLPKIPNSFEPEQFGYLRDFSYAVDASLRTKASRDYATDQILLVSPNKKIYALSVDDTGNITTTLVQG